MDTKSTDPLVLTTGEAPPLPDVLELTGAALLQTVLAHTQPVDVPQVVDVVN
jgi:hypothetical protein